MTNLSKTVRIRYVIDQRSTARGAAAIRKNLRDIRADSERTNRSVQGLGKGATGTAGGLKSLSGGLSSAAGAAGAFIAAATAAAAASIEMAERVSESQIAFQNLPFQIDSARTATRGLVDDLTLAQNAITANRLGVTRTGVEYAELAEVATKLGQSVGQDATKSVQDLTTALARQSPMILDNLGIQLKVSEANEEYASRLGKVSSELTDAEKKQAFVTIGLERARDAAANVNVEIDETAQLILEFRTAAQNFGTEFSRSVLETITEARDEFKFLRMEIRQTAETLAGEFGQSQEEAAETVDNTTDSVVEGTRALAAQSTLGLSEFIPFLLEWRENQRAINVLLGETNRLNNRGGVGGITGALTEGIDQLRTANPNSTLNRLNTGLKDLSGFANQAQQELKGFFEEAERNRGRRGRGGRSDPFLRERLEFQQQITEAINAERLREFSEATSLQRNYLADVRAFESELAQARQPSIDRFALERERAEFLAEFQENAAQRTLEVELARADSDAERFRLQQEAFAAREAQISREIELTNDLDERARLQDERESVRHQATLARIEEERRAREEAAQGVQNAIQSVSAAENGAFQLSATIAGATIKGEQRKKRVLDGIKAAGLFADGAVAGAQSVIAFASGNVPQGIALAAAAANAFAQGSIIAAGNARGGGGGGGRGPTAAGEALSRGEPVQRAQFSVDRGAPISVREDIEGNPNNTTSNQTRDTGTSRVVNVGTINVTGKMDRLAVKRISQELANFDGRAV